MEKKLLLQQGNKNNTDIIHFIVRFLLGLNFFFASIAHLKLWKFYSEDSSKIFSWVTNIPYMGVCVAISFLVISIFLLLGYQTFWAVIASMALVLLNHISLLFTHPSNESFNGPFYNSFHHTVPFLGFSIILLYSIAANNYFSLDKKLGLKPNQMQLEKINDIVLLAVRIFIGMICFRQGLYILMQDGSSIKFAENNYVKPFETSFIPKFLLWFMGVINPFVLLIGGVFVTIGFKTKWAAFALALFLLSIAFGHLLGDPFETTGDISMYGFNNLAFVLFVLWLENDTNRYCLDKHFK
jgi:uncharacterized membrane protein YphA (DoxX/SURF4 family)